MLYLPPLLSPLVVYVGVTQCLVALCLPCLSPSSKCSSFRLAKQQVPNSCLKAPMRKPSVSMRRLPGPYLHPQPAPQEQLPPPYRLGSMRRFPFVQCSPAFHELFWLQNKFSASCAIPWHLPRKWPDVGKEALAFKRGVHLFSMCLNYVFCGRKWVPPAGLRRPPNVQQLAAFDRIRRPPAFHSALGAGAMN